MSYQALYRVWRPQNFDELVGQSVITETLKNAIKHHQTSHAYLFTGPRGTGKTSAAKIFAKAINCPHQQEGNPCNECELCQSITRGELSDVIEIDAASNNGVEEIRNLRDNVRYAPSTASYKIYIIDEVHMLTTGAFNALLKTLEEPPSQVIFILATTEPHKIPATIISRTQRFDFQRITQQHLVNRMKIILDHHNLSYQEEALEIIARASNGGMRDSLSLLDQAISFQDGSIDVDAVLMITGSLSQIALVDYLSAIYQQAAEKALDILNRQFIQGKQAGRFVEDLILLCRDLLLTMHSSANYTLLHQEEIQPLLDQVPSDFLYHCIDALNNVQDKMRFSTQEDLYVEVMTIQLAQGFQSDLSSDYTSSQSQPNTDPGNEIGKMKAQIQYLQDEIQRLKDQTVPHHNPEPISEVREKQDTEKEHIPRQKPQHLDVHYELQLQEIYCVLNQATRQDKQEMTQAWQEIMSQIPPQRRAKLRTSEVLAVGPELALVSIQELHFVAAMQHDQALNQELFDITGDLLRESKQIIWILAKEWPDVRKQYTLKRRNHKNQEVPIDATVQQALATVRQSYMMSETVDQDPDHVDEDHPKATLKSTNQTSQQDRPATNLENDIGNTEWDPSEDLSDTQEELEPQIPDHVSKAIDLFGEENLHIHYDS